MNNKIISGLLRGAAVLACLGLTALLLAAMVSGAPITGSAREQSPRLGLAGKFDQYVTNALSDALEGVVIIEKEYWLSDEDVVAPEPDPEKFGVCANPADMAPVIEDARELLAGQELLFSTECQIPEGSEISWYLDKTILAITWKDKVGNTVYTYSEVKIAHPSQFRRFLSGGEYGSGVLYTATEMSASVNAVAASSADYYAYRTFGNSIFNGQVMRWGDTLLDTCYIDDKGDLLFTTKGQLHKKEDLEDFIARNNIRFSIAFGPLMIQDRVMLAKNFYSIGEVSDRYSRAALCQQGELHYMVVTANAVGVNIVNFAEHLYDMGVKTAYALDGGQTATIVLNDQLINQVDYGGQRDISDIIYFATAIPSGKGG